MNSSGDNDFAAARQRMVREQLTKFPARITAVMNRVPRHEFIPEEHRPSAYADVAVPIGFGQTISQPYIVALMTTQLQPQPGDRILEIGTGSGYQAAVLAELGAEVYSIEIVVALAERAKATLQRWTWAKVHLRTGDGAGGWPEAAPFAGVIVTCAPAAVPPSLVEQLQEGGRMLIPVGADEQFLLVLQKQNGQLRERSRLLVRFVPMIDRAEQARRGF